MYTRDIQAPRQSPVENGIPIHGTWIQAFDEVDLLEVQKPYSIPMFKNMKDTRIKEWETFYIQDERIFLEAQLCNFKYYRTASLVMYDRETRELLELDKMIPGGSWKLPRRLNNSSVDSRSYRFFFRIHSWLDAESIQLELNIEQKYKRPAFTAHATFDLAIGKSTPLAVSLLFSERRNMYAYKVLTAVRGDIVYGGKHIHLDPAKASGLFCDFKGYYPYRMRCSWCTGMGFDNRNRRFGFALGENQAREPYTNNENALWIDGKLTPLPPVKITQNNGFESDWIIQDMEGMVDLVFTPVENGRITRNYILTRSDYENPLGYYNGLLVSAEGEELPLRNVWGTAEKLYLRV